jgi:hypothetical protein
MTSPGSSKQFYGLTAISPDSHGSPPGLPVPKFLLPVAPGGVKTPVSTNSIEAGEA